jgi:hypothetical protein
MIKDKDILLGNIYFWLITNFICWTQWYTQDVNGFISCYVLAIPFFFSALIKSWAVIRVVEYSVEKMKLARSYNEN